MRDRICENVQSLIGQTPLVRLGRVDAEFNHRIFAKCEFMNPGGSVKDRIGFFMIEQAEKTGALRPGGTVVEATGGNTGMALAMAAITRGYKFVAVLPTKASAEKRNLLRALGAEVHLSPDELPPSDPNSFVTKAREIARRTENAWFADQFANPHNPLAHFQQTGPEIWSQTEGNIDVLVAGIGTGGTLCGAGAFLKEKKPQIQLVMADPEGSILRSEMLGKDNTPEPFVVDGIGGDFVPQNASLQLVDRAYSVSDKESIETAIRLFREEGLFAGGTSGCILAAAIHFCREVREPSRDVVVILPDGGRPYLTTIFDSAWRRKQGLSLAGDFG